MKNGIITHSTDSPEITDVTNKIIALREKASQASSAYVQARDAINRDPSLSDQGKKERTDALEADRRTQRLAAMEQEKRIISDQIAVIERRLDGFVGYSSESIMAFRDAQDRAEAITDADRAASVMARALRTNDKTLAHALYRRAVDNNWTEARNAFATDNPTVAGLANDVHELREMRDAGFNRAVAYL